MRKALVLVAALVLSGCAADDPSIDAAADAEALADMAPFLAPPQQPLRFAAGDYEGELADTATFSITEQCAFDCTTGGEQVFDLTPIVPTEAPVELAVQVTGARASMEFVDAFALGDDTDGLGEYDGQATNFGLVVIRGESGKVLLHVYNPGGFSFPPEMAPTADWEARSVVRADRLVAGVPAAVKMKPGERLNLTGDDVEEAVLIAPDGTATRDQTRPFEVTANGTAGTYLVIMGGQGSTAVNGPNVTMAAKRLSRVADEPHALASGSATTWTFTPEGLPVAFGLTIESKPAPVDPFGGGGFPSMTAFATGWELTVTAPGNVAIIEEDDSFCRPFCGGGYRYTTGTGFLDERLSPGEYAVSVTYTGNDGQAYAWATVIV